MNVQQKEQWRYTHVEQTSIALTASASTHSHLNLCDYFNWKKSHRQTNREFKKYEFRNKGDTQKELLKKRTRIVLQHNLDPKAGLVNGTRGVIVDFEKYDERKLPRARKESEERGSNGPILARSHATYEHHEIRRYAKENNYQPWPVVKFDDG
ncbi:hypothetical protein J4E91_003888 [Alternaria rosae]|nr:hypothetical protein J4E91_003888 [Alternaria rosae]